MVTVLFCSKKDRVQNAAKETGYKMQHLGTGLDKDLSLVVSNDIIIYYIFLDLYPKNIVKPTKATTNKIVAAGEPASGITTGAVESSFGGSTG